MSEVFCPECGTGPGVDEDGLCCACGATATGRALDRLLADYRTLRAGVEGETGEDTWPRPCDVCGEMLDCPSDGDEPYLAWQRSRSHRMRCLGLALHDLWRDLETILLLCWELATWRPR